MTIIWRTLDGLECKQTSMPNLPRSQVYNQYFMYKRACKKELNLAELNAEFSTVSSIKVRKYRLDCIEGDYWADTIHMEEIE